MAAKKAVVKTAASSRPKRTPKPIITAAVPTTAVPKPKKATTATKKAAPKKAAPKKAAPKKTAATKVTKKKPVAKATKKKSAVSPNRGANPLGPAAAKKVADRKAEDRAESALYSKLSARYSAKIQRQLKEELKAAHERGEWLPMNFECFLEYNVQEDVDAWKEAKKIHPRELGGMYNDCSFNEMSMNLQNWWEEGEFAHCIDIEDYMYWLEAEKIKMKNRENNKKMAKHDANAVEAMKGPVNSE